MCIIKVQISDIRKISDYFFSGSNFDLIAALNLATSVICLSVVWRKLFQINGLLQEIPYLLSLGIGFT